MYKVLVIDDDRIVCKSLDLLLNKSGYNCLCVHQPNLAIDEVQEFNPDLVLLDMNFSIDTSGKQGLALLVKLKERFPELTVILITGWATLQLAVGGMKKAQKIFLRSLGTINIC